MKKILLFTQFFYPDKTGTGKVLGELFEYLANKKFGVEVLSSRQVYNDSKKKVLPRQEYWEKIKIHRVFSDFKDKNKAFGRIYNYLVFFVLAAIYTLTKSLHKNKDVLISVSNPPIMPLLPALLKGKCKFVYLIHDLYPDIAIKMGATKSTSFMAKMMFAVNNYVFMRADKIIVLGRDMRNYLLNNYNIETTKIVVITNWAEQMVLPEFEQEAVFKLVYSGNIGKFHNLEMLVDLAASFKTMEMHFIGSGAQKEFLENKSKKLALENVKFIPFLEQFEYSQEMQMASAFVVSLEKNLTGLAVPSKFYTYLSFGKPIICISEPDSEMARIITEAECGFVIGHGDVVTLDSAVEKLLNKEIHSKMSINAQKVFSERYEKSLVLREYDVLLSSL